MSGYPDNSDGNRGYSRFDDGPRRRNSYPSSHGPEPVATVTLDKIGDFLELDFRRLFVWLRAGLLLACIMAVIGGILGGAYGLLAKPRYTVGTDVLIDPANLQIVNNDLYSQSGQVDGQLLTTGSKLRVLTSRNVLARVVDDLDLVNDPEFFDPTPGFNLSALLGGGGQKPDPRLAALKNLAERVSATADEKSFVATLSVSSESADKAILISQAIVTAFQKELAKSDSEGAGRAAAALDDRLAQLKSDVQLAEERVEAYRRTHNLSASNGQLVTSQTMTQLNAQIGDAQSRVIAAQASYDALLATGSNATSVDVAASPSLAVLLDRAGGLQQQLDAQAMIYGQRHPNILRLKAELAAVTSHVKIELNRSMQVAKATLDKANAALAALRAQMQDLEGDVFADNDSQVELRELERDAASRTAVYESFLSRARQITEREQIDTTNIRVISTAVPPSGRSWPPSKIILIGLGAFAGFAAGMMLALAIGIVRDLRRPPPSLLTLLT